MARGILFCGLAAIFLGLVSADSRSDCEYITKAEADPSFADTNNCLHGEYKGPIGESIKNNEPGKIAKVTKDHGQALVANMATLAGPIPVVGSYFSAGLALFAGGMGTSTEDTINAVIDEINKEIKALKEYVDARIQEHEVTRLSNDLKGFMRGAKLCASYDGDDQQEEHLNCLVALNLNMATEHDNFAPGSDNIASYEQTLPLFRQFGDLRLTVLQDLMQFNKAQNKLESFNDHLLQVKNMATEMYDHSQIAVQRIVQTHTEGYSSRSCRSYLEWHNPSNPFSTLKGQCATCSQVIDGKECVYKHCVAPEVRGGRGVASRINHYCMGQYEADYRRKIEEDLNKYWKLDMLDVADQWLQVAAKAEDLLAKDAKARRDVYLGAKRKRSHKFHSH